MAHTASPEIRVAAHDEPLARIIGRRDGGHVALVEQRHLQGSGVRQLPDRRRPQRRDPVEPRRGDLGVDARLRDHPAVADQHHMRQREALLDLVDLRGERARIGGIALEYLDRHRAAVRRAQQAVDDLQLALFAVAVVAALRQFAAAVSRQFTGSIAFGRSCSTEARTRCNCSTTSGFRFMTLPLQEMSKSNV